MSDQDIFKNNDTIDQTPAPQEKDENKQPINYDQMLSMIVDSEGKQKYTSVEDVIKSSVHAQAHITTLEGELSAFKEGQKDNTKMEEIIAAIKQSQEGSNQEPNDVRDKISPTDIQDIVNKTITDISNKSTQKENLTEVVQKFTELYGDKASETLYGKAKDLGLSQEDINSLSEKNPAAVFAMLGVNKKADQSSNADLGSVNTDTFQNTGEEEIPSSMGYISSKQLEANWLESKKRTLARLEAS